MNDDISKIKNVRIDIKWSFISPALKTASGIVEVISSDPFPSEQILLFSCKCKVASGLRSFQAMDENTPIPTEAFKLYENYIKCMIDAYFDGMNLNENQFFWVPESLESYHLPEKQGIKIP